MLGGRESVEVGEAKIRGALFDADELFANEGGECGGRNFKAAQLGDRELPLGSGQFGKDGLLILIEFGKTDIVDEDSIANGAARVAGFGGGFAGDPFLAQHALEDTDGGASGGAEA